MSSLFKKVLSGIGLYKPLLNAKKNWDQQRLKKVEEANRGSRLKLYSSFLSSGDLVFDVGANVGNRVESFLQLGCKVVAVEPQPSCIASLQERFGDKIYIEPVGLAGEAGEMQMHIADESTISTFSKEFIEKTKNNKFRRNSWNDTITVSIATLETLIKKYGTPKFCKIDVEGFEPEVLKGLKTSIPIISFEYNVPELINNVETCVSLLTALPGTREYNYAIGESMQYALPHFLSSDEFLKHIQLQNFIDSDFGDIYVRTRSN